VLCYPDGPGTLALFVAAYTTTAQGDGRRSLRIVAAGIALLAVEWLLVADLQAFNAAGWVLFRIGAVVMAAALGESVRSHRALAAEALERAEQASRAGSRRRGGGWTPSGCGSPGRCTTPSPTPSPSSTSRPGSPPTCSTSGPEQACETLRLIEQTSARALDELRATLGVLRDAGQDGHASPPGLAQLEELAGLAREAGLHVDLELASPPRELPGGVDRAAYRILQESVTDAIRHAGLARLTVSVGYGPGELELLVADDGRGPREPHDAQGTGRGIAGMRERAALLGGELTAGPRPGGGFQVRARLPLHPEEAVRR
jgi:signal transduction histidine kinase